MPEWKSAPHFLTEK